MNKPRSGNISWQLVAMKKPLAWRRTGWTHKVTVYVISGILASLASLILIACLGAAELLSAHYGSWTRLPPRDWRRFSDGGKGSIFGTLIGVIILGPLSFILAASSASINSFVNDF